MNRRRTPQKYRHESSLRSWSLSLAFSVIPIFLPPCRRVLSEKRLFESLPKFPVGTSGGNDSISIFLVNSNAFIWDLLSILDTRVGKVIINNETRKTLGLSKVELAYPKIQQIVKDGALFSRYIYDKHKDHNSILQTLCSIISEKLILNLSNPARDDYVDSCLHLQKSRHLKE